MNDTTQPPQEHGPLDTINSLLAEYERLRDLYNASFTANDMKTANRINVDMAEVSFGIAILLLKARKEQEARTDVSALPDAFTDDKGIAWSRSEHTNCDPTCEECT